MKYINIFVLLGICLFGYSLSMKPYTDEDLFEKKYMELSSGQSKEYFELRDSMLTSKYRIQDTGITFFSIALLFGLFLKLGNHSLKSPRTKSGFVLLAIGLPFLTVAGYVFDLLQGMDRQEFPHWADSLGIPLAGAPIQLIILLVWALLHLFFLKGLEIESQNIALSKSHNYWLIFLSVLTFLLLGVCMFYGQYWYALPGILWLYFYLSLAAVRHKKANT
jgi:hypothetical protein